MIKLSDDINYEINLETLQFHGFSQYFSSLAGEINMKNDIQPPQGAREIFIGCGEINSDVLKMGAVGTPAELFDQREYPWDTETNAKAVRNYYAYYAKFDGRPYESIGFSKQQTIFLTSVDTYDKYDESKLSGYTVNYQNLYRCGSVKPKPADFDTTFKIVFYYR